MQNLCVISTQYKLSTMDIFLSFLISRLHGMSCFSQVSSLNMTEERSRLMNWDRVLNYSLRSRGSIDSEFHLCTKVLLFLYLLSSLSLHDLGEAAHSGTCYIAELISKHTGFNCALDQQLSTFLNLMAHIKY